MIGRSTDWLLAMAGGALLALMIHYNSLLARHTSPIVASWVAHGLGAAAALLLMAVYSRLVAPATAGPSKDLKPPLWFYLGGIPGTFTVILAAITVNSSLSLSGTIAFMLVGQVLFGIVSDHFGLFRTPRRRIVAADFGVALAVLTGSALIIFDRV
ncbi:DMT family transporter [Myxococcus stipitatus]|uniref:DMT family transporter n=1 Tax=Myxococcus stipitatus TaxID=83455 RepID=UPI003144F366